MYAKAATEGMSSFCDVALISRGRALGVFAVANGKRMHSTERRRLFCLSRTADRDRRGERAGVR